MGRLKPRVVLLGAALLACGLMIVVGSRATGPPGTVRPTNAVQPPVAGGDGVQRPVYRGASTRREPLRAAASFAPSQLGSLEILARWRESEDVAAGVAVMVTRRDPRRRLFEGVTDEGGRLFLAEVPLGEVWVGAAHGGGLRVSVQPNATARVELLLDAGISFRLCVTEPSGQPIAGAKIWVSTYFNFREGLVAGSTGEDGCFEARDIQAGRYVAAFADGYEPSGQLLVGTSVNSADQVRIVLQPGGSELFGQVLDAATGEAIAGANVLLGVPSGLGFPKVVDGLLMPGAPPRSVQTDENGFLEVDGLPRHGIRVAVKAAGYAWWSGHADWVGARHHLRAELERGCDLDGVVVGSDGEPVALALVEAGERAAVGYIATRSDEAGHFRMRDLPCRVIELSARRSTMGEGRVIVEPLLDAPVLIVLSPGVVLSGYMTDFSKQRLVGWWVSLRPSGFDESGDRKPVAETRATDEDGRFLFTNCERAQDYDLEIREPMGLAGLPLAVRVEVKPSAEPLRIALDARVSERVSVRGILVTPSADPVGGETLALVHQALNRESVTVSHQATGEFVVDELPIGRYVLEHITSGVPLRRPLQEFTVGTSEPTLDLGPIRIEGEGRTRISALGLGDRGRAGVVLKVDSIAGENLAAYAPSPLDGFSFWAAPGTYIIRIYDQDGLIHESEFTIVDGEERTLRVSG